MNDENDIFYGNGIVVSDFAAMIPFTNNVDIYTAFENEE